MNTLRKYGWLIGAAVCLVPLLAIALVVPASWAEQPVDAPQDDDLPLPPRPPDNLPPVPELPADPPADPGGGGSLRRDVDLTVFQYASKDQVQVGDQVEFTITAMYLDGERPAENVLIFEEIPPFFDIIQASTSWGLLTVHNNQVSVSIDQLYPGDVVTVYVLAQVNQQPAPEYMNIIASVNTSTEDQTPTNDWSAVPIFILPQTAGY